MSTQIRITRTPELSKVLKVLQSYYAGLTENEIIKKIITDDYRTKVPFEQFPAENISPDLSAEINDALDSDIEGPYHSAEEFITSLKS